MACRTGITTDPIRRKEEWKREYPSLKRWQQWGVGSREKAQEKEDKMAASHGCEAHHGGSEPDGGKRPWYLYHFYY